MWVSFSFKTYTNNKVKITSDDDYEAGKESKKFGSKEFLQQRDKQAQEEAANDVLEKTRKDGNNNKQNSPTKQADTQGTNNGDDEDPDKEAKDREWTKNKDGKWHHENANDIEGVHNRPNAQDSELQRIYKELWRDGDKTPSGTAAKLREEVLGGSKLEHLQKAENRLTQLIKRVNDKTNQLSSLDKTSAEKVINDLKDAINFATRK
jgi:hypothetical protein